MARARFLPLCAEQCFSLLVSPSRWGAAWAAPRAPARKWLTRSRARLASEEMAAPPASWGSRGAASPKLGGSALAG